MSDMPPCPGCWVCWLVRFVLAVAVGFALTGCCDGRHRVFGLLQGEAMMDDKALLEQLAECERERQRQSLAAPHYHPIPGGLLECKCGDELTRPREENERLRDQIENLLHRATTEEAAQRVETAEAERDELRAALGEAAMSMETIANAAFFIPSAARGSSGLLLEMSQVRGYARSRAAVARAALRGEGEK